MVIKNKGYPTPLIICKRALAALTDQPKSSMYTCSVPSSFSVCPKKNLNFSKQYLLTWRCTGENLFNFNDFVIQHTNIWGLLTWSLRYIPHFLSRKKYWMAHFQIFPKVTIFNFLNVKDYTKIATCQFKIINKNNEKLKITHIFS